ncbi:MAG: ABC transporter ATP-binding protein [Microcoleaceae cyanobacterium]
MAQVILENIYKSFTSGQNADISSNVNSNKAQPTLRRINLTVAPGEFLVIVGPSGCGKSTLLRLIAGLEAITAGTIWVNGKQINNLLPKERDIAMVFQNYALYPHLTVYDNLAFGLRRTPQPQGVSQNLLQALLNVITRQLPQQWRYDSPREQNIRKRVMQIAVLLQIETLLKRYPKQLSGGQKQRVALGRAMARNPQVFLMDEPLSNLDAKLRSATRAQIVQLQQQLGVTTLYVTHDQTEAMTMGSRIAVMNQGQILQVAAPLEIYSRPANKFVAEFIGSPPMNFLSVDYTDPLKITHFAFHSPLPSIWQTVLKPYHNQPLILGIRPEHLQLDHSGSHDFTATVDRIEVLGHETLLFVHLISTNQELSDPLQVRVASQIYVQPGSTIELRILWDKIHLFDVQTHEAIFSSI